MRIAVVFPGQGSQRPGLGRAWADHPAWELVGRAEAALGRPVADLLLEATADELSSTRNAQLSVLVASLLAWEALRHELPATPVAWAGHSLGQVTALVAAGTVAEGAGLTFAGARADATQRAADEEPGAMAAFLGATGAQANEACGAAPGRCWVANVNAPGQVVIAGTPDAVDLASQRAADLGVRRVRRLDVGGAFHTPLMTTAADALGELLDHTAFASTGAPIVTNDDAAPHDDGTGWPARLARHLVVPVRWADCVATMIGLGADAFVEVGPGTALTGLIRRIAPDALVLNVAEPADIAAVVETVGGHVAKAATS